MKKPHILYDPQAEPDEVSPVFSTQTTHAKELAGGAVTSPFASEQPLAHKPRKTISIGTNCAEDARR